MNLWSVTERFIQERTILNNVSPATISWYRYSLKAFQPVLEAEFESMPVNCGHRQPGTSWWEEVCRRVKLSFPAVAILVATSFMVFRLQSTPLIGGQYLTQIEQHDGVGPLKGGPSRHHAVYLGQHSRLVQMIG
jgi:hypothetical protein